MARLLVLLCFLMSQAVIAGDDEPKQQKVDRDKQLEQAVATVNAFFEGSWPGVITLMEQQMTKQMADMGDGAFVRKVRITKHNLHQPPTMSFVRNPDNPNVKRLRFSLPGKGKWTIKAAGEIIPPWQRNKNKWRKLRLTLKDLSLVQDYDVVDTDGVLSLEPVGAPQISYRLTSPNLLYRAVLGTAQRFMGDALQDALSEDMLSELPLAELALVNLGGLQLDNTLTDLGRRMQTDSVFMLSDIEGTEPPPGATWVPLDGPIEQSVVAPVDADAFAVNFVDKEMDFFAESFTAEVDVKLPPGTRLEAVVFRLGNRELARVTKPPYRWEVFPDDQSQVLIAEAHLSDGIMEDDFLYIEGRGHIEELAVQLVKVPLSFPEGALSEQELRALTPEDFKLTEDGIAQTISSVGFVRDQPLNLSLVMDMSGSMEGERLQRARAAASGFVQKIFQEGDVVQVIAYNDRIMPGKALTSKNEIMRTLRGLRKVRGGTYTFDAVNHALKQEGDPDAMRVVLLVTDGFNSGGKTKLKQILRRLQQEDVVLFSVGIGVRGDRNLMRSGFTPEARPSLVHLQDLYDLAMVTGGRPFFVDKPAWLERAFGEIEDELRAQLAISYYSNQSSAKQGQRTIEVDYLKADLPLRHKESYWNK